jgi:hypothetical protein
MMDYILGLAKCRYLIIWKREEDDNWRFRTEDCLLFARENNKEWWNISNKYSATVEKNLTDFDV